MDHNPSKSWVFCLGFEIEFVDLNVNKSGPTRYMVVGEITIYDDCGDDAEFLGFF